MLDITVYRVTNSDGDSVEVAVDDIYDNVQVVLVDKNGVAQWFESESYHLGSWAYDYGFKYERYNLKVNLDNGSVVWE